MSHFAGSAFALTGVGLSQVHGLQLPSLPHVLRAPAIHRPWATWSSRRSVALHCSAALGVAAVAVSMERHRACRQVAPHLAHQRHHSSRLRLHAAKQADSGSALQSMQPIFDFAYWAEHIDEVQKNADNRKFKCDVKEVAKVYHEYRTAQSDLQELAKKRNAHAKLMKGKLEPDERQKLIDEGKEIKEQVLAQEQVADKLYDHLMSLALPIPNLTHPDVPIGPEENANVIRINGTPRTSEDAGFELKDHLQLGEKLGFFDFDSGGKVSGQKFVYFRNGAALLEVALVQWAMHQAVKHGFTPIITPDLVREQIVAGCGFQPRENEATQIYSVADSDLCLTGTAEIPLAGIFANEIIIAEDQLPQKLVAFGHAFRTEAGSSGSENRGIYRLHQFSKVELFAVTRGGDTGESDKMLAEIRALEEDLYTQLGFCFRVLDMPTEELGAPAYRKYDMEAWMPGMQKWGEISSCSNCTDFQARRLNLRYKENYQQKKNLEFPHTLNGTACAVPRMIISILETFQQADGSVLVPEVLRPYMPPGMDVLKPI